jgi:hypothetical protein
MSTLAGRDTAHGGHLRSRALAAARLKVTHHTRCDRAHRHQRAPKAPS